MVKQDWPLVTVDYSESGKVVGIESVGMHDFTVGEVCDLAGVKLTAEMLQGMVVNQNARSPAMAYA